MDTATPHAADSARAAGRKALLVLGMHRSGTSAMTRVIALCGAALPQHRMVANESNALGYWEPQRIVDAHDAFLREAGTAWDDARDYPASIFTSPAAAACRQKLTGIVREEYGGAPLFVLKDPRLSRLMPLWRPVLDAIQATPHAVIMVRNPLEIAASLTRREGWSEARGLTVWLRYILRAERDTRGLPRCFIAYDRLVDDWPSAIAKLSSQLAIAFPERDAATDREIDGFIRRDMKHHGHDSAEMMQRADVTECVKRAYRCVTVAIETGDVDYATLDSLSAALDSAEHLLAGGIGQAATQATDDAFRALALAELDRANAIAAQSERTLRDVRASWSWRLTKPFRDARRLLTVRPDGRS